MDGYDVGQVCKRGHAITGSAHRYPEFTQKHCAKCGSPTIKECPSCGKHIQGEYHVDGVIALGSAYEAPAFCVNCGQPFPWTQEAMQVARELADELDDLKDSERELLKKSLEDIVRDTPRTQLAVIQIKRLLGKTRGAAAGAFRDAIVGLAATGAKKLLLAAVQGG